MKSSDLATIGCGVFGIGIWWFLSSDPSGETLFCVAIGLGLAFLMYCAFAMCSPAPQTETETKSPPPETNVEPAVASHK